MKLPFLCLLTLSAMPVMAQKVITADVLITDLAPLENSHWQRQSDVSPKYPLALAKSGVQGCAVVAFTIDKNGKPHDIEIKQAFPAKAINRSTTRLVKELQYVATNADAGPQQRSIRIDYCIADGNNDIPVEQQCLQRTQYTCG